MKFVCVLSPRVTTNVTTVGIINSFYFKIIVLNNLCTRVNVIYITFIHILRTRSVVI